MPSRPPRPCTTCGAKATYRGKCSRHTKQGEKRRGSASQRGYDKAHAELFREPVLAAAGYVCQIEGCDAEATVADHWPLSRRELVAQGLNPNDPKHGRGLCTFHHGQHTATMQGHWHKQG